MRTIHSSWSTATVDTDAAEALTAAVKAAGADRVSRDTDQWGRTTRELTLTTYAAPDGTTRHAVACTDGDGEDLLDTDDEAEATAYYEKTAREMDESAGWDETDVNGLTLAHYAAHIERTEDPALGWTAIESTEHRLDDNDLTVASYQDAAQTLLDIATDPVSEANRLAELCRRAGVPQLDPGTGRWVRVRIVVDGRQEAEATTELEAPEVTDQDVAEFVADLQAADHAERERWEQRMEEDYAEEQRQASN
ncbi:hypothetical protein [Kitasatospora sp. NPDC004289]